MNEGQFTPVESLCKYKERVCKRRCLPGYFLCDFHYIYDDESPYNQCAFVYEQQYTGNCPNPVHKSLNGNLCHEHRLHALLASRHSTETSPDSSNRLPSANQSTSNSTSVNDVASPSLMQLWERKEDMNFPQGRVDLMDCWSSDCCSASSTSSVKTSEGEENSQSNEDVLGQRQKSVFKHKNDVKKHFILLKQAQYYTESEVLNMAIDRWSKYLRLCRRTLRYLRLHLLHSYVPHIVSQSKKKKDMCGITAQNVPPSENGTTAGLKNRNVSTNMKAAHLLHLAREKSALKKFGKHSSKVANQRYLACVSKFAVMCSQLAPWRKHSSCTQHCKYRDPTTTTWEKSCGKPAVPLLPYCLNHLVVVNNAPPLNQPITPVVDDSLNNTQDFGESPRTPITTTSSSTTPGLQGDVQYTRQHLFRQCGEVVQGCVCTEPVINWNAYTRCSKHTNPNSLWPNSLTLKSLFSEKDNGVEDINKTLLGYNLPKQQTSSVNRSDVREGSSLHNNTTGLMDDSSLYNKTDPAVNDDSALNLDH